MKRMQGPIAVVLDLYRYKKQEYSLLYVLLFFCVTFEVVGLSDSFAVTDLLYFLFAFLFFVRKLRSKGVGNLLGPEYFYPFAFILLAIISYNRFGGGRMFQSELRFIFNCGIFAAIYSFFKGSKDSEREKLVSSYIYFCVIASTFIFIQYISFYIFHYTIKYDIGDFNAASSYLYSASTMYRTGGFFNEPSWFALFTGPVLEIAYRRKKYKELIVCVVGLVLSTSSMGFLFLIIFGITKMRGNNIKTMMILILAIGLLYLVFPLAFGRIAESFKFDDGDNTNDARVITPFLYAIDRGISLWGFDISSVVGESIFFNSFVFVLMSFGLVGLMVFLKMILQRRNLCISLILLSGVIIEGCYGRVDFWMALLASSVYCFAKKERIIVNRHLVHSYAKNANVESVNN